MDKSNIAMVLMQESISMANKLCKRIEGLDLPDKEKIDIMSEVQLNMGILVGKICKVIYENGKVDGE